MVVVLVVFLDVLKVVDWVILMVVEDELKEVVDLVEVVEGDGIWGVEVRVVKVVVVEEVEVDDGKA